MRRGTALAGSAIFLVIAPGTVMFLHPMYVAGILIITGQALFFGNLRVLAYVFGVWLIFHLFVLFYEEPVLHRKFGAKYDQYRINVRRWMPRLRPWENQ